MPFTLIFALFLAAAAAQRAPAPPTVQTAEVKATYPHDAKAFTQGLFFADGALYESTGLTGQSTIRRVRLEDGKVLQMVAIPADQFGEGSTAWGKEIVSLTWQHGTGYRWDRATLKMTGSFRYPGEGWGITQNGRELIMSDGTAELRFLDPVTMVERRRVTVTAGGRPVTQLNELEWVKGEIFANVWMTGAIARIDPATGNVTGWIDLSPLVARWGDNQDSVLNGIAYDAAKDRLFVTGKNWERLFEIDLVAPAGR